MLCPQRKCPTMARRIFDYQGYPCDPTNLSERTWFYVQKEGVIICTRGAGNPTEQAVIPWRLVKKAVADHEKAKERKALVGGSTKP
jgi:hypothetical protein